MIKIASKILEKIEEICIKKVEEKGFELEYVEQVKENMTDVLRVVITKDGDMTTQDCENISKYIEEDIDKIMKEKSYVLEISSAGLERQIKNIRLFKKYINEKVFVRLFKKTKFKEGLELKEFEAIITNVNEDIITFEIENKNKIEVNFKDIATAHTIFDFDNFFKNNEK